MALQPAMAYLGRTDEEEFPLLLFIGREYNNESGNEVRGLGTYSFRESPRSAFWNKAYGLVARISEQSDFKRACISRDASPILFSNALPRPILNRVSASGKGFTRRSLEKQDIQRHIQHLCALNVLNRVRLVILSGLDKPEFRSAVSMIKQECERREKNVAEIPYLGSRLGYDVILEQVSATTCARVRATVTEFNRFRATEVCT